MAHEVAQLLAMTQPQRDALFRASPPGGIPNGPARGSAIVAPGAPMPAHMAEILQHFGWQGRVFDAAHGVLKHQVPAFDFEAIVAQAYPGPSWFDAQECIVLDYAQAPLLAHWLRDEIRCIGPGLYLGKAYSGRNAVIDFCLQLSTATP